MLKAKTKASDPRSMLDTDKAKAKEKIALRAKAKD